MALTPVLRTLWRAPPWMAKNDHPFLEARLASGQDTQEIRLSSSRKNRDGNVIASTYRLAVMPFDFSVLDYGNKGATVRRLDDIVQYLSRQVFPRPLPTFRIRRNARRLSSRTQ